MDSYYILSYNDTMNVTGACQKLTKTLLILLFLLVSGCANDYEKLEVYFYAGHYLKTLQTAVEGYRTERFQNKIESFLHQYGNKVVKDAYTKGVKLNHYQQTESGLNYLIELEDALIGIQHIPVIIPALENTLSETKELIDTLERSFLADQESLASEAFRKKEYKKSIMHYRKVLAYNPVHPGAKAFIEKALNASKIHVVLTPLFTESQTIPDVLRNEIRAIFNKQALHKNILKTSPRLQGLDVTELLQDALVKRLHDNKLDTLSASGQEDPAITRNITLRGILSAVDYDNAFSPEKTLKTDQLSYEYDDGGLRRWGTAYFEYPIYTTRYEVTYTVTIQLIENEKVFREFTLKKVTESAHSYKSEELYWDEPVIVYGIDFPPSYEALLDINLPIDREQAVRYGVDELAEAINERLLYFLDM